MKILIVDDHPMTVDGYENAVIAGDFADIKFFFEKSYSCEEAYNSIIKASKANKPFDLVLLDYTLPGFERLEINNGSDLVPYIRSYMPQCKVIMITAHSEILIIYEILKKIYPEGLVVKNDINPNSLTTIIKTVMNGEEYSSPKVKNCVADIWKKDLMVEDHNRQILMYMSKGFKIKDLDKNIALCSSAIQKRVILMKKAFKVSDDNSLVREAIQQGFI